MAVGPMARLAAVAMADHLPVVGILRAAVGILRAAAHRAAMVHRVTVHPVVNPPVTARPEEEHLLAMGQGNPVTVVATHLPAVRPPRRARRCFGQASAAASFCCLAQQAASRATST